LSRPGVRSLNERYGFSFFRSNERTVSSESSKTSAGDVRIDADVPFAENGEGILALDLARPGIPQKPLPCILVLHGGGWYTGSKSDHSGLIESVARRGYVGVSADYRLVPSHRFPAHVEDVKCAVRFLRAHAKPYGIDPGRIGVMGFSAGGHLAMMLGTTAGMKKLEGHGEWENQSSQVQAVVSYFGPTDLAARDWPDETRRMIEDFLGGTGEEIPDVYQLASPACHVTDQCPPMLLFQGTRDEYVPYTQAYAMIEALTRAGAHGHAEMLINHGHTWGEKLMEWTLEVSFRFLEEHL
jgi:acetyl esterase/lipase